MSGFMWKATVRNVNRALKEVNAFEWEGDIKTREWVTTTGIEIENNIKDSFL